MAKLETKTFLKLGAVLLALLVLWYVADGVIGSGGVTRYGLLKDYGKIWDILEKEVPYFENLNKTNTEAIRTKYFWKIFFCPTEKKFFELCQELFSKLGSPAGIHLVDPGDYIYEAEKILSSYPGGYNGYYRLKNLYGIQDTRFETYVDKETMEMYTRYEADGVGLDEKFGETGQISAEVLIPHKAAIIYIPSMKARNISEDRQKLYEIYSVLENFENVAFWPAGDGNGSAKYWQELILKPNISGEITAILPWLYKSSELVESFITERGNGEILFGDAMKDWFGASGTDIPSNGFNRLYLEKISVTNDSKPALNGKIWIYIDEETKYAAESLAQFCERSDFAVLFGRESGGMGLVNAGDISVSLPKSRLIVRFSALYEISSEGSLYKGVKPKVYLYEALSPEQGFADAVRKAEK